MSTINEVFSEKYDFSQFENFVEIINSSDFVSNDILREHTDLKSFVIGSNENMESIKHILNPNISILDASNSIPKGYKIFVSKGITDILDVDQFQFFLENLYNSTDEYSRLILLEKGIQIKEIEDQMNIKNLNDISYTLSESSFVVTNVIKLANSVYIIEALRR